MLTAVKLGAFAAKEWKWIIGGATIFFALVIIGITGMSTEEQQTTPSNFGSQQLSEAVLAYETPIKEELKKYGLEDLTPVVLGIMQQESGGTLSRDVMQASESLGLPPNTIQDPMYSIQVGVKHFASVYKQGTDKGLDIKAVVQSYNFGSGYLNYVESNGKVHTQEVAKAFSAYQMSLHPGVYTCGGDTSNFRYPYCYGDWSYVDKVFQYVSGGSEGSGAAQAATGSPLGQEKYEKMYNAVLQFEGYPYTWGGATPATSFDCSGLTSWAFRQIGYNLPRTAQLQYNATKRVKKEDLKPGDLIFFKTASYNNVTHVGIYVGNNKMYDANNGGVGFSDLNNYWSPKIVGYGRVS
ncbi:bifunctional lytic transglycosylase/C40 family peptidase [Priestia flexa]|uniref:bifunctional lytic transglycosylase/C40 family peptidase n=1 Tax=Priestia flexa TaxID=86664 RepID=UPI00077C11F7|nr:bifunctional lytic transglycosylase/C40 family peptidase [Priestia flexa]MED4587871.1 bifunctional lytic transglycosylase/C40 family peptidase [Priestia flexa]